MKNYSLSWVVGVADQAHGGNKKLPVWQDVECCLDKIKKGKGSLTLSIVGGSDIGPQFLQVFSDEGNYILSLGEDDGADYVVRSYLNPELKNNEYEILGDIWSGELVCLDFSIVKEAFETFFLSGDFGLELLR